MLVLCFRVCDTAAGFEGFVQSVFILLCFVSAVFGRFCVSSFFPHCVKMKITKFYLLPLCMSVKYSAERRLVQA